MIRFRCRCGNVLEALPHAAGGDVQCPRCGWLVSVPELPDLERIEADGTFRIADDAPPPSQKRALDVPSNWDMRGVDRRQTLEQILKTGAVREEPAKPRPARFDPETGQQIHEFELAEPHDQQHQPMRAPAEGFPLAPIAAAAAGELRSGPALAPQPTEPQAPPPTLAYAAGAPDYARLVVGQAPIPLKVYPVFFHNIATALFQPANLLVVLFVFGAHILAQGLMLIAIVNIFPLGVLAGLVAAAVGLMLLAHYVNVLDETGPERRDELPSVMRNVQFGEDFLRPLFSLIVALMICFGPAAYVARELIAWPLSMIFFGASAAGAVGGANPAIVTGAIALALLGLYFFPAVLLTAATSGIYLNLAPHRIFGVIRAAPGRYMFSLALLAVSLVSYVAGLTALGYFTLGFAQLVTSSTIQLLVAAGVAYPALFAAVYFSHWFIWSLGKTYQDYHESFGWVWQRHISSRKDATKQLERIKAAQIRAEQEERLRRSQQVQSRVVPP